MRRLLVLLQLAGADEPLAAALLVALVLSESKQTVESKQTSESKQTVESKQTAESKQTVTCPHRSRAWPPCGPSGRPGWQFNRKMLPRDPA